MKLRESEVRPVIETTVIGYEKDISIFLTLIDSGAELSILYMPKSFCNCLCNLGKIRKAGKKITQVDEFGNAEKSDTYIINELHIGSYIEKNVYVEVRDIEVPKGRPTLILGYNVLKNYDYTINNSERTIELVRCVDTREVYFDRNKIYRSLSDYVCGSNCLEGLMVASTGETIDFTIYVKDKKEFEQLMDVYSSTEDVDRALVTYNKLQQVYNSIQKA